MARLVESILQRIGLCGAQTNMTAHLKIIKGQVTQFVKIAHCKQTLVSARVDIALAAWAYDHFAEIRVRYIQILAIVSDPTASRAIRLARQIAGRQRRRWFSPLPSRYIVGGSFQCLVEFLCHRNLFRASGAKSLLHSASCARFFQLQYGRLLQSIL